MWHACFTFYGPEVGLVRLTKQPRTNEHVYKSSPSLLGLLDSLPEWAPPLLDDESSDKVSKARKDSSKPCLTIQTEKYATVAIFLRDSDDDDMIARVSSGAQGKVDITYTYDYDHPPVVIVSIFADGYHPFRMEMSLPAHDSYCRPPLTRER